MGLRIRCDPRDRVRPVQRPVQQRALVRRKHLSRRAQQHLQPADQAGNVLR